MEKKNLSLTFRFLRFIGMNYSEEEYGQVSVLSAIRKVWTNFYRLFLLKMMNWAIFEPINPLFLRPRILRLIGCNVGKDVFIGYNVEVDIRNPTLILLGGLYYCVIKKIYLIITRVMITQNYLIGRDQLLLAKDVRLVQEPLLCQESQ